MSKPTIPLECMENIEDFCTMIVDEDGKIIGYSKGCERIEELKREDVMGKNPIELYNTNYPEDPENPDAYAAWENKSLILDTLTTGNVYENFFCYYKTNHGKACNILYNAFPIYEKPGGKIKMAVCTYREVSDYLNLISIINKQEADIKKLSKVKRQNGTQYDFEDIIGDSIAMQKCVMQAKIAAETEVSVLISGETGTGKEVIAQSIHNASPIAGKKFVAVNCSAIPETLLESTLFGTCSGSFTGAKDRKGLFEEAEGGTLFLDELNSMDIGLQAKMLRVLEMNRFMKVGGTKEIECHVRILSALNENPVTAIKENRLRSDLFYRLAVFHIDIPPLRRRPQDILELSLSFIKEGASFLNKKAVDLSKEAKNVFLNYPWPGNIRELKHAITQSIYILNQDARYIDVDSIPPNLITDKKNDKNSISPTALPESLRKTLDSVEKEIILKTLKSNDNNISQTARDLKISRQNLQNKIRKYEVGESE